MTTTGGKDAMEQGFVYAVITSDPNEMRRTLREGKQ